MTTPSAVDALAQFIRAVDGNHSLGAGALAEKICEWQSRQPVSDAEVSALEGRLNDKRDEGWTVNMVYDITRDAIALLRRRTAGADARDAERMRWLLRMSSQIGFDANPWLINPSRIDEASTRENIAYAAPPAAGAKP